MERNNSEASSVRFSMETNFKQMGEKSLLLPHGTNDSVRSLHALPGMKIRAHRVDKKTGTLQTCITTKEALGGGRGTAFWIDIDADERDRAELQAWLQQLKLSPFLTERLAAPFDTWTSQVLSLDHCVLAVFRILPSLESSDDIAHMAALQMKGLLLTFTSCPRVDTGGLYASALRFMQTRETLPDASTSGVLCAWLLFHVERTSRATRQLRMHTLAMDEAMDRDIESVDMDEIIKAKDMVLKLLYVAEEQMECVQALLSAEAGTGDALDFSHLRGNMGVLLANAVATERMAVRVEKHLSELRQRHTTHEQERTNRRLAVLTVLSAVFLPLTLLSGVWGMNFEYMPELQSPGAYPMALGFMVLIAMAMTCFFWKTGWCD